MFIDITDKPVLSIGLKIIIIFTSVVVGIIGLGVTIGKDLNITWLCLLIYVK